MPDNGRPLTTGDVARYCGVSRMGVIHWIRQGKLKAHTTPGGHYRIRVADFQDFLQAFDIPIDASFFGEETKRILVVASNPSTLRVIVRALSAMPKGYEIDIAQDDTSAVAAMANFKPVLVILDATMSRDAPKLNLWIKDNLGQPTSPAVLLTGPVLLASEGEHPRVFRQVPLKAETLQAAVDNLLTA